MARTKVSELTKRTALGKGGRKAYKAPAAKLAPTDEKQPRKPRRSRPYVRAIRAVRAERGNTKPVFPFSSTRRTARLALQNFDFIRTKNGNPIRITPKAVQLLRLYLEHKAVGLLDMSKTVLMTSARKRIRGAELQAVVAIRSQDSR